MSTLKKYKAMVDVALERCFDNASVPQAGLYEAMRYSMLAGGKRIRPILLLEFCRICGGDVNEALAPACAVELLHTYSLIHDDLPCMDDDDMRRGRPTNHIVYGEMTAVLAGDALQAEAFGAILSSALTDKVKVRCAAILAKAAGADGICAGQLLDMLPPEGLGDEEAIRLIHSLKTGALISAACEMGVAVAEAGPNQMDAAKEYAQALGMAFQIRDDVLDRIADAEELGKPAGPDEKGGKRTFVTLFGERECERLIRDYTEKAKAAVSSGFDSPRLLIDLAESLANRTS